MPITINLDKLNKEDLLLSGDLLTDELQLDLGGKHDLIRSAGNLNYEINASKADDSILIQGHLKINFSCECARCIKLFTYTMDLPSWTTVLSLSGPDTIEVIGEYVDLTPSIREDILLSLPRHPLCDESCKGLASKRKVVQEEDKNQSDAWDKLDQWKQQ
jgi:uncharacterized metal-binding protein YceD (DUF177 family)